MSKTFTEHVAVVSFLVKKFDESLETAIEKADVPAYLREQVRSYFADPVEIVLPDLLVDPKTLPRCPDLGPDTPQPCTAAFRRYLLDHRGWNRSTVESLEEVSRDLVRRLPSPDAAPAFQCRGLVIGYIQSGKTATMAALIGRAADQGYKLMVVLGGLYNDLRAQTQRRLDQEIAGVSDDAADRPLVTHDAGAPKWVRLTRSGLSGDFQPGTHNDLNPGTCKLAVIKKNVRVLERFTEWIRRSPVALDHLPALVIDDEADQASINTNYGRVDEDGNPVDPSQTNAAIRELLDALPKCAYVGFTATPFANVLIDAAVEEDLYPRDFIASLPAPSGYMGPRQLFGLGLTPSDLSPEQPVEAQLDVIRLIPPGQLQALSTLAVDRDCPPTLIDALLSFILSSSARLARGQTDAHFTMFVHPSHLTGRHAVFTSVLEKQLVVLRHAVTRPRYFPQLLGRAKELWESDFSKHVLPEKDGGGARITFDTLWPFAKSVVNSIEVKTLNYGSEDVLHYGSKPWKRYLVVGGNRLSRGLTLEGLSVSVFLRDVVQYDTLLQMGRWFGYRRGYGDLTRIFVDQRTRDAFADLARIEEELRADIRKYSLRRDPPTPLDLKPLIRAHPTLAVTSSLKMGAGRVLQMSFAGTTSQTVALPLEDPGALQRNLDVCSRFVENLGPATKRVGVDRAHIWADVDATRILQFLASYEFSKDAIDVNQVNLSRYVQRQNEHNELIRWDVIVPPGSAQCDAFCWATDTVTRKVARGRYSRRSIKTLVDPRDVELWRKELRRPEDDPERGGLLVYVIDRMSYAGEDKQLFERPHKGKDVVALAFVFPHSKSKVTIQYVSQA